MSPSGEISATWSIRSQATARGFGAALHAHTTESDGELAPPLLAAHYERAGYDVLAITDHWKIADAEDGRAARRPERRAELRPPRRARRPRARVRRPRDPGRAPRARGRVLRPRRDRALDRRRTAASPTSRTRTGRASRPERSSSPRASSASRCSTPAASSRSVAASPRCTGTSCSRPGGSARRSRPTTRTIPGSTPVSPGRWLRVAEPSRDGVLAALRDGAFYASSGPALHDVRRVGETVEVRCSPCRSVTLVSGKTMGAAVNAGRLGYRHRGEVDRGERRRADRRRRPDDPAGRFARARPGHRPRPEEPRGAGRSRRET